MSVPTHSIWITLARFSLTGVPVGSFSAVDAGPPFYQPPWSPTVVGMVLDDDTDWDEVAELVTESYRLCAPQKLRRRLDR